MLDFKVILLNFKFLIVQGFLGIGGSRITAEELEALRQIAFALGLPASASLVETRPEPPKKPELVEGRIPGKILASEEDYAKAIEADAELPDRAGRGACR